MWLFYRNVLVSKRGLREKNICVGFFYNIGTNLGWLRLVFTVMERGDARFLVGEGEGAVVPYLILFSTLKNYLR